MFRFLCYRGADLLLADLLYRPEHLLIRQSHHAKERKEPLNGDGFGVGWYTAPSKGTRSPSSSASSTIPNRR